jgi:hypothetical protein
MSNFQGIVVRIADLGSRTLGVTSGHTIYLDDNAAGWGWFVDKTPWNDSEFTTPGNQGEKNRMDLLTVLEHELGHVLGYEHAQTGVMQDTFTAGTRRMAAASGKGGRSAHSVSMADLGPSAPGDTLAGDVRYSLFDSEFLGGKRRR